MKALPEGVTSRWEKAVDAVDGYERDVPYAVWYDIFGQFLNSLLRPELYDSRGSRYWIPFAMAWHCDKCESWHSCCCECG